MRASPPRTAGVAVSALSSSPLKDSSTVVMFAGMAPRWHQILRSAFVLALVISASGLAPAAVQAANAAAGVTDCCPQENDPSSDELPCSPLCSDCACGVGLRIVPELHVSLVGQPAMSSLMVRAPTVADRQAPKTPVLDGLLRPPRI